MVRLTIDDSYHVKLGHLGEKPSSRYAQRRESRAPCMAMRVAEDVPEKSCVSVFSDQSYTDPIHPRSARRPTVITMGTTNLLLVRVGTKPVFDGEAARCSQQWEVSWLLTGP